MRSQSQHSADNGINMSLWKSRDTSEASITLYFNDSLNQPLHFTTFFFDGGVSEMLLPLLSKEIIRARVAEASCAIGLQEDEGSLVFVADHVSSRLSDYAHQAAKEGFTGVHAQVSIEVDGSQIWYDEPSKCIDADLIDDVLVFSAP